MMYGVWHIVKALCIWPHGLKDPWEEYRLFCFMWNCRSALPRGILEGLGKFVCCEAYTFAAQTIVLWSRAYLPQRAELVNCNMRSWSNTLKALNPNP